MMVQKIIQAVKLLSEQKEQLLIAIDGGSASGKSTLASEFEKVWDCNVFHMDDFFLQPHQRTRERFMEPGGNVDRERFLQEVLLPLQSGAPFSYQVFDCSVMALSDSVQVTPKKINVIEGAYSMHPALRGYYDLGVFLDIDPEIQSQRILHRNGERMHRRFVEEWIPLEKRYFDHCDVKNQCQLVFSIDA